jgi:hypothetical protein
VNDEHRLSRGDHHFSEDTILLTAIIKKQLCMHGRYSDLDQSRSLVLKMR